MIRHIIIAAGLMLAPTATFAKDLTGTWVRDGARSDVVPDSMYWTVRDVVTGGTRGPTSNHVIVIAQDASTMRVTDSTRPLRIYQLDGQDRTVAADTGVTRAVIKASQQGDVVVVKRTQTYSGLPGSATLETTENWALAPDGKSLTLTTIRQTPAMRVTYNEVYIRQAAPAATR